MKLPAVLVISVLFGSGVGVGLAYWSVGSARLPEVDAAAASSVSTVEESQQFAMAVVDEPNHNFGTMLRGDTSWHEFLVRNEGKAPLRLSVGKTSCKCTLGDVAEESIPPGGSTPVRLEWVAKTLAGPFRQTATIKTNDPNHRTLTLTVEGEVNEVDGLLPRDLNLGVIDADAGGSAAAYFMSFDAEELQVSATMADTTEQPERFEVTVEPVEPSAAPKQGAVAAARIYLQADAGLPQGPIHEWIAVRTNLPGREKFLMPITGQVRGAITIHGRGWSNEKGVLNLGALTGSDGGESTVLLSCRGPLAPTIKYMIESIDPPELVAELEKRRMVRDDLSHTKLRVAVPAGTRPMVRMARDVVDGDDGGGDAVILLKSNHPKSPEIKLFVRFVVQG